MSGYRCQVTREWTHKVFRAEGQAEDRDLSIFSVEIAFEGLGRNEIT